jgi:beta-glucosidase
VQKLRKDLPKTKILLLAIFPRGEKPDHPQRQVNIKANEIIAKLADNENVHYLDIGPKFLETDGTLATSMMPDRLHLNGKSYRIWAESIEPTVAKLMGAIPEDKKDK